MGFIKLDRGITDWGWYDDPITKVVFIHLLLNANWKDGEYHGVEIKAGQVVFGRKKYAEALGLSEQNVRTAIKNLHKKGEISTSEVTNRFTVITIEKWAEYQGESDEPNQQPNQQLTNSQPTTNQQLTTSKKGRIKNKEIYNVQEEFDELWRLYPKKSGRKDALRHYKAARKRGTTFDQVRPVSSLIRITSRRPERNLSTSRWDRRFLARKHGTMTGRFQISLNLKATSMLHRSRRSTKLLDQNRSATQYL